MQIIKKLILIVVGCASIFLAYPQQKHALLIGINNYYSAPNYISNALQGCVNDALAVKATLINKFGFDGNNIKTLLNNEATKEAVIIAFMDILKKCHAGDAVVFYFSGHGVWMTNTGQSTLEAPIKRGMNQAMVMSNLYAPNLGCLLADASIKKMFNKFVDKKVILTAFFDCCFSGSMPMAISPFMPNAYNYDAAIATEKSIPLRNLTNPDEDIFFEDIQEVDKDILLIENVDSTAAKALQINAAITINNSEVVPRPSEKPNSNFLSMSACTDSEKGIEVVDETGTYHGAFTKAWLHTVKNNPANISVQNLIEKINNQMGYQLYRQTPIYHFDKSRLKGNILGITINNGQDALNTICTAVQNGSVKLHAGTIDGLAVGNILQKKGAASLVRIKVLQVNDTNAIAAIIAGAAQSINVADTFFIINKHTTSAPLIKLYIAGQNITVTEFNQYFKTKIEPITQLEMYRDYQHFNIMEPTQCMFLNNDSTLLSSRQNSNTKNPFVTMLPIPVSISNAIKKMLLPNQNIQLVNNVAAADFILYLNYAKENSNSKPGFVFTFYKFITQQNNVYGLAFSQHHVKINMLPNTPILLNTLVNDINTLATKMIRTLSSTWMNDYPKK